MILQAHPFANFMILTYPILMSVLYMTTQDNDILVHKLETPEKNALDLEQRSYKAPPNFSTLFLRYRHGIKFLLSKNHEIVFPHTMRPCDKQKSTNKRKKNEPESNMSPPKDEWRSILRLRGHMKRRSMNIRRRHLESKSPDQHGQNNLGLDHGQVLAHADFGAAAEREE